MALETWGTNVTDPRREISCSVVISVHVLSFVASFSSFFLLDFSRLFSFSQEILRTMALKICLCVRK